MSVLRRSMRLGTQQMTQPITRGITLRDLDLLDEGTASATGTEQFDEGTSATPSPISYDFYEGTS